MGKIINVDSIAAKLERELANKSRNLSSASLVSVQVGEAPDAEVYVKNQKKIAESIGINFNLCRFPAQAKQEELIAQVEKFNCDESVKGIIINRPLPTDWKISEVFSAINPNKDVEGVSPYNLGRIFYGDFYFISPTVLSVLAILDFLDTNLCGRDLTVVGFSSLIGMPLTLLLGQKLATVSATHIGTYQKEKLPFYVKNADVLITAVGKPHFIKAEWIKQGAIVVDVGISKKNAKIVGDVEFEEALPKVSWITPVPGGVGKLTSLFLFQNLLQD